MQIVLPPDIEVFVQEQIDSGKYHSPVDVVVAALQLLKQKEEDEEDIYKGRLTELQQAVQVGFDDLKAGRVFDGLAAMAQIRANLHEKYKQSEE